jgi:hypothetical protein
MGSWYPGPQATVFQRLFLKMSIRAGHRSWKIVTSGFSHPHPDLGVSLEPQMTGRKEQ